MTRALPVLLVVSRLTLAQPSMGPIVSAAGACLDVAPDSPQEPLQRVMAAGCGSRPQQVFSLMPDGSIRGGDGRCLDVEMSMTTPGARVLLFPCQGQPNQRWQANADGTIRGIGGQCLDTGAGLFIVMNPCTGSNTQVFRVPPSPGPAVEPLPMPPRTTPPIPAMEPLPMPTDEGLVTLELTETLDTISERAARAELFEAARHTLQERAVLTASKIGLESPHTLVNDLRRRAVTRNPARSIRSEEVVSKTFANLKLVVTMRFVVDQARVDADLRDAARIIEAAGKPTVVLKIDEEVRDATVKPMTITRASGLSSAVASALEQAGWVVATAVTKARARTTLTVRGNGTLEYLPPDAFQGSQKLMFGDYRVYPVLGTYALTVTSSDEGWSRAVNGKMHAETAVALTLSLDRSRRAVLENGARQIQAELAKVLFDRLSGE